MSVTLTSDSYLSNDVQLAAKDRNYIIYSSFLLNYCCFGCWNLFW